MGAGGVGLQFQYWGLAAIRIALLVHTVAVSGVLDDGGTVGELCWTPAPARSLKEEERGRRFPPPHHTPGRHLLLPSCANLRRRPTTHTHRIRAHVLVAAWRAAEGATPTPQVEGRIAPQTVEGGESEFTPPHHASGRHLLLPSCGDLHGRPGHVSGAPGAHASPRMTATEDAAPHPQSEGCSPFR